VTYVARARGDRAEGGSPTFVGSGLSTPALAQLVEAGPWLTSVAASTYRPKANVTEHHSLVEAAARVPHGVVCLLSALHFHGLGTQNPHDVWLAIDVKAWKPVSDWPSPHRALLGRALTYGVEGAQARRRRRARYVT
jgi:hypothetical protein